MLDAAAPAAPLDVTMTWLGPGQLEIVGTGSFASVLQVERRADDGAWKAVEQADPMRLRTRCEDPVPASCTNLERSTPFRPAPWAGVALNSQCGLGARGIGGDMGGTIRMTTSSCDGTRTASSPPLAALADDHLAERMWAAESTTAVHTMRLDPVLHQDATLAPEPGKVVGFAVRAGTEQELDAGARAELATLLTDKKGYNDRVAKRCKGGNRLGFRITRSLPSTGAAPRSQELEVAVDLACNALLIARGDSAPRHIHGSYFDAMRPAVLAFVQRLYPADRELTALR